MKATRLMTVLFLCGSFYSRAGEIVEVNAASLVQQYNNNILKAQKLYDGETIVVYGNVKEVTREADIIFLTPFNEVLRCRLARSQSDKAANLKLAQAVGIKARCVGKAVTTIWLENGILLDTWKAKEEAKQEQERKATLSQIHTATAQQPAAIGDELAKGLMDEAAQDPTKKLEAMLAAKPDDRQVQAELGHLLFVKAKTDSNLVAKAIVHLDKAVGESLEQKADIDNWEGRARFELAYLTQNQGKPEGCKALLDSIEYPSRSGGSPAPLSETALSCHLFAGTIANRNGDAQLACKHLSEYLSEKIETGTMTPTDLKIYVYAWKLAVKNMDCPPVSKTPGVNLSYFCHIKSASMEGSIMAVKDKETIRQVAEILSKSGNSALVYSSEVVMKKLQSLRN